MNSARRPFLLSITLTFLLGYVVSNLANFVGRNFSYYEEFNRQRRVAAVNGLKLGVLLLKHGEWRELVARMEEIRTSHEIDHFRIQRAGAELAQSPGFPPVNVRPGTLSRSSAGTWAAVSVGEFEFTVGVTENRAHFFRTLLAQTPGGFFWDVLLVVLMASGITFFYSRDIRAAIGALQSRGRRGLHRFSARSHEGNVMLSGLRTYQEELSRLRRGQENLGRQLTSALRSELDSGRTPPYDFECTMVRTDVNRYSTIIAERPEFLALVNEFFTGASEVVARYQGFVVEFLGDEIIYYFKGGPESAGVALAAIRDIERIADQLHGRQGFTFRVKSALASGNLHFGLQVDRFALSGGVFVETVRILGEVEEKDENATYLPQRLATSVSALAELTPRKTVHLRGVPGPTVLHRVEKTLALPEALEKETAANLVSLYRNEEHVRQLLTWLRTAPAQHPLVRPILSTLQACGEPFTNRALVEDLQNTVAALLKNEGTRIGGLITALRSLVPHNLYGATLKHLLDEALSHPDRRVVANAVDALVHFDPGHASDLLRKLSADNDNRVAANCLVKLGQLKMDASVIRALGTMMDSERPSRRASGCYALGTLRRFYEKEDAVYWNSSAGVNALLARLPALARDADPMVARQATRALGEPNAPHTAAA